MPRAVAAALLSVAALAVAGCGTDGLTPAEGDVAGGKSLFKEKCGGCHTLREAETQGSNPTANPASGPNLDEAFAAARMEGFEESTIRETVRHQIDFPTPPMPENLVEGDEADAVAAYVAAVVAKPDAKVAERGGGGDDPKSIFTSNCGSCHVLADAGTSGTAGPNLDESKPTLEGASEQIRNGGGGMPAFGDRLTDEQIRDLARYIVRVTQG